VDKLISISKSLALDIIGISRTKRVVVPIGIDLKRFSSKRMESLKAELGISESKTVIGTVARLSKEKVVSYIIDLAEKAPDMEFVIVGDGPEKHSLAKRVLDSNLNNVHMVGHKKNVEDYYNIFNGFVLASKIEGTPISIIEAMASGVPVFTNMVGAIPDLIIDGKTGFKIEGDPVRDLKTIRGELDNLPVIKAARQYVVENHDIDRMYVKFLDSIITLDNFFERKKNVDALVLPGEYI
jgi:glycosyltransferase involved in cell wall biosynthesis